MKKALFVFLALQVTQAFAAWPVELPWMNAHADSPKKTFNTAELPHSIFVVEAYFNGCHWCNVNAPQVNQLAQEFEREDRVQFLDVGVDSQDSEYQNWIRHNTPNHPVLKDPEGAKLLGDFNIEGYPTTLLLDCHGVEKYRHVGAWGSDGADEVRAAIQRELTVPGC